MMGADQHLDDPPGQDQSRFSRRTAGLALIGIACAYSISSSANAESNTLVRWTTRAVTGPGVSFHTFASRAAQALVSYHIYLPPQYASEPARRFPVLYWLHGTGGGLVGIPRLAAHFDEAIRTGRTPAMVIVFPNGLTDSMWCNSKDGAVPMETVVIDELVPHVDATFRTKTDRNGRIVEGFSMGGYGAARLGFAYPGLFGAVSMLGAGPLQEDFTAGPSITAQKREEVLQTVYGGDLNHFRSVSPRELLARNAPLIRGTTLIRQVIGDLDQTLPANQAFHEHLTALAVPHEYAVLPGIGHDPMAVLTSLGERMWAFYDRALDDR